MKSDPVVFLLWGAVAQRKRVLVEGGRHRVLMAYLFPRFP